MERVDFIQFHSTVGRLDVVVSILVTSSPFKNLFNGGGGGPFVPPKDADFKGLHCFQSLLAVRVDKMTKRNMVKIDFFQRHGFHSDIFQLILHNF